MEISELKSLVQEKLDSIQGEFDRYVDEDLHKRIETAAVLNSALTVLAGYEDESRSILRKIGCALLVALPFIVIALIVIGIITVIGWMR